MAWSATARRPACSVRCRPHSARCRPWRQQLQCLHGLQWRTLHARRNVSCNHDHVAAAPPPDIANLELAFANIHAARASGLTLVDIREPWERMTDAPHESIEVHVPLSSLLDGRAALPQGGRYLIVCAHGVRSLALAERLRGIGYREVYSLRGGLAAVTA
jgi:rhodanese-related sulfurtransferase